MNLEIFQKVLVGTSVGIFLLALAFDIVVSYSVYSTHHEYFFNLEQNEEFIKFIRYKQIPYYLIAQSSLGFLPMLFLGLELRFKRDMFAYLLIASVLLTIYLSFLHFQGGLSWWRF